MFKRFLSSANGATSIEYAVIAGLMAGAIAAGGSAMRHADAFGGLFKVFGVSFRAVW